MQISCIPISQTVAAMIRIWTRDLTCRDSKPVGRGSGWRCLVVGEARSSGGRPRACREPVSAPPPAGPDTRTDRGVKPSGPAPACIPPSTVARWLTAHHGPVSAVRALRARMDHGHCHPTGRDQANRERLKNAWPTPSPPPLPGRPAVSAQWQLSCTFHHTNTRRSSRIKQPLTPAQMLYWAPNSRNKDSVRPGNWIYVYEIHSVRSRCEAWAVSSTVHVCIGVWGSRPIRGRVLGWITNDTTSNANEYRYFNITASSIFLLLQK